MNKVIKVALIGAGGRGNTYTSYALRHPEELKVVAVAEPIKDRREKFAKKHDIPEDKCFENWDAFFAQPVMADAVMICTQDLQHTEPAVKAMKKGYHVLLEKPMTPFPEECMELARVSEETGRHLIICHVLRYTNFFQKLKELLDTGKIGKLLSIQHNENIAFWHFSHSFVRGPWRNKEQSGPLILTKSCHDMDILYWLAGAPCKRLSSYGETLEFSEKNCPEGAPKYCLDGCPHSHDCKYYAPKIYIHDDFSWLSTAKGSKEETERVYEDLKTSPLGRCVYQCDNNVVDHMVTSMIFENGVTCTFNLSAFTNNCYRDIKFMGTDGEIYGNMEDDTIKIIDFNSRNVETIKLSSSSSGHGGGDEGIVRNLIQTLRGESESLTSAKESLHSHMMCYAAEESRMSYNSIDVTEFKKTFLGSEK